MSECPLSFVADVCEVHLPLSSPLIPSLPLLTHSLLSACQAVVDGGRTNGRGDQRSRGEPSRRKFPPLALISLLLSTLARSARWSESHCYFCCSHAVCFQGRRGTEGRLDPRGVITRPVDRRPPHPLPRPVRGPAIHSTEPRAIFTPHPKIGARRRRERRHYAPPAVEECSLSFPIRIFHLLDPSSKEGRQREAPKRRHRRPRP